jgi:hypothetical protein
MYNQVVRALLPVLACLALAGCHHNLQNEDAVKQGVMDYLSTRQGLNVSSMNITVGSIIYRENECDATVNFAPKDSSAAQGMSIRYTLEKKGDRWVVKPRPGGGNPHEGMGANPHSGMGMPAATGTGTGALPPGHPTIPPQSSPQ